MNVSIDRHLARLERDGWCVLEHVLDRNILRSVEKDLEPCFAATPLCKGAFYGERTRRFGALLTQGSRLIGSYDSVVAFGQKRALIVWQRIMLPDGSSMRIDNVPATDASGYSGLQDKVDFHTWALLKGVALSMLLGVGSQLTVTGESDLVQAIRESTQQNVSRAGDQLTSRNLNIQPTITIRPGATVRLVVHKDLILAPWREKER